MILGIAGTLGAGKGTVVEHLMARGFKHYSSSDLLIEILKERGETVDRDGMNRVANELRSNNPAGVPAENYQRYEAEDGEGDVIFEALHSMPEADFIRSIGGIVLGVTADPDIRYDRVVARGSVKDDITKEKFIEQQAREEKGTGEVNKSNIFAILETADFLITNNGTLEELTQQLDDVLEELT